MMRWSSYSLYTLLTLGLCFASQSILYNMWLSRETSNALASSLMVTNALSQKLNVSDLNWYPPKLTAVNDLATVLNGSGIYGFVFNDSITPASVPYSTYNWCNMPHVRAQEYIRPAAEYKLQYVEVIHRHHKRTPYASNSFPHETYPWFCDDEALFYYGTPKPEGDAAAINWQVYTSPSNPLVPAGFDGTCQFPQITRGGLQDSQKHGEDLYGVYHDMLGFLPDQLDHSKISFRVTNNQITSQVAGQVIFGMYPASDHDSTSVLVQPVSVDSLEPAYACPAASSLYSSYAVGSNNTSWTSHLDGSIDLFSRLDAISGVNVGDSGWHNWFDHYFDNLSARLCHQKPLPCNATHPESCVTQDDADAVFRRGEYEYSFIYRDDPRSLRASTASFGIWFAELAANIRNFMSGKDSIFYRHNLAHDGSLARLLSVLQVEVMVWPGMGSEVVFELYQKDTAWYLRVLWSGQVLTSSNPTLGSIGMLPVETFLAYIDGLVGEGAVNIPGLCSSE